MKSLITSLIVIPFFIFNSLSAEDSPSLAPPAVEEADLSLLTLSDEFETLFEPIENEEEETSLPKVTPISESLSDETTPSLMEIEENQEANALFSPSKILVLDTPEKASALPLETKNANVEANKPRFSFKVDFEQVFSGSPIIYSVLFVMSMLTLFIWLYSQIHLRLLGNLPEAVMKNLQNKLNSNQYEDALSLCQQNESLFCKMLASGIASRKQGMQMMLETMKSEGKRASVKFWQRLALLNDIAIIAPMLGLLGTVLGMFYAFYDVNRSVESVSALFDGLGISVGTTVAGLLVAIIAMILYSTARYRLVRRLALVENEVHHFASLIDQNP